MTHYICLGGCQGESDTEEVCVSETCKLKGKVLKECDCVDGLHYGLFGMRDIKVDLKPDEKN
ncbi:hypothetical protein KKH43_03610 [Patescibacteria group bacterium]|nr:hypothetical protein [Patescibacteria group bacterium]